jgi:hypothetical protein
MNFLTDRQGYARSVKVLGLLLRQIYVGPNSLWAPFVTVIVQLLYCLMLYSGFAGMHPTLFFIFLALQDLHA